MGSPYGSWLIISTSSDIEGRGVSDVARRAFGVMNCCLLGLRGLAGDRGPVETERADVRMGAKG